MRIFLLCIIISVVLSFPSFAQKFPDTLSKKEIYLFVNWFIKETKLRYPLIKETLGHAKNEISFSADKIVERLIRYGFSDYDTGILHHEALLTNQFLFDSLEIISHKLISLETAHASNINDFRRGIRKLLPYHQLSIPFFAMNRKRVMIFYKTYCGFLYAEWGYYIFNSTGKEYELLEHKVIAVS